MTSQKPSLRLTPTLSTWACFCQAACLLMAQSLSFEAPIGSDDRRQEQETATSQSAAPPKFESHEPGAWLRRGAEVTSVPELGLPECSGCETGWCACLA
ncbi:unnamed protein product, partial [Protopolystoma xenopodis]